MRDCPLYSENLLLHDGSQEHKATRRQQSKFLSMQMSSKHETSKMHDLGLTAEFGAEPAP